MNLYLEGPLSSYQITEFKGANNPIKHKFKSRPITSTATSNESKGRQILQPVTPLDEEPVIESTDRSAGKAKEAYY